MPSHTMKDVAKKEVKAHEKRMHKMQAGGSVPLSNMMKQHGRGIAKVMYQKSGGRGR
jgi:hypothetical protein